MSYSTDSRCAGWHGAATAFLPLTAVLLLASAPVRGQQDYIPRYNLYAGYTFLDSPHVSLFENGFHTQAGVNPTTWLALGFDYSVSGGSLKLTPDLLTNKLQEELGELLAGMGEAGLLPPGFSESSISISTNSRTQTFAGGPQLEYRHYKKVTLFLRPSVGLIHEVATPKPTDAVSQQIVLALVGTSGNKTDTVLFYGFGGGVDFNIYKHVGLRVQADLVYDHLFSDTLKDGRYTTRFSVGPFFNVGKNIAKKGR